MTTITGLTAARMLAIEAASVVDGDVDGDNLILVKHDGSTINAGNVRGPAGDAGPAGSDLVVVTAQNILDIGVANQIRAGRQLTATDFTNMGLSAPIALWNLSNLNDSSGNGRNLSNKGSVPFTTGINGLPTTAAQFNGGSQGLYIADTGGSDPFRIRVGTVGAWVRPIYTGGYQGVLGKFGTTDGNRLWWMDIEPDGRVSFKFSTTGLTSGQKTVTSGARVCDNAWHFVVGQFDGAEMRIYVDGVLDGLFYSPTIIYAGAAAPTTVGCMAVDASNVAMNPLQGRVDEAFVTSEILSEAQIRNLYSAKIAHSLGSVPKRAGLTVVRRKKGAALIAGDFPTQPVRLYNFSAGVLTDQGSNGQALTASGSPASISGVDGSAGNAYKLAVQTSGKFTSTDTGLPSGTGSRSCGLWFAHAVTQVNPALISWGSGSGTASHALWITSEGLIAARTPVGTDMTGSKYVSDGRWHLAVLTEEASPADSMKRKLYLDGVMVGNENTLNSITLAGASKFVIGNWPDAASGVPTFDGAIDSVFVCNYVLDPKDIAVLYAKGSQALGVSPKNVGDHVESMTSTDLLCLFDTLETQDQVNLVVA